MASNALYILQLFEWHLNDITKICSTADIKDLSVYLHNFICLFLTIFSYLIHRINNKRHNSELIN